MMSTTFMYFYCKSEILTSRLQACGYLWSFTTQRTKVKSMKSNIITMTNADYKLLDGKMIQAPFQDNKMLWSDIKSKCLRQYIENKINPVSKEETWHGAHGKVCFNLSKSLDVVGIQCILQLLVISPQHKILSFN